MMKPHSGIKRVTKADHCEPLVDHPLLVDHVDIWPLSSNTGNIYVGGPETVATAGIGALLDSTRNDSYTPPFSPVDLHDVFIDAANAGDGVAYVYWSI